MLLYFILWYYGEFISDLVLNFFIMLKYKGSGDAKKVFFRVVAGTTRYDTTTLC